MLIAEEILLYFLLNIEDKLFPHRPRGSHTKQEASLQLGKERIWAERYSATLQGWQS